MMPRHLNSALAQANTLHADPKPVRPGRTEPRQASGVLGEPGVCRSMRGLSIRQPWAFAIAQLDKRIENRTWTTSYRGPIAVHASLSKAPPHVVDLVASRAMVPATRVVRGAAVGGAIVAVADLVDVCSMSWRVAFSSPSACRCGRWAVNQQHHLVLANVRPLAAPVPCRGALSLWRVPEDELAEVDAQLSLATTGGVRGDSRGTG